MTEVIGRGHAERLLPMIAELPDGGRAGRIFVGCGPGSFTGIRVGVAAARALGLGWGAAVSGYSTVALLAAQGFARATDVDALCVAQLGGHGELFVQNFANHPFRATSTLASLTPSVAAAAFGTEHVAGEAAEALIAARGFGQQVATRVGAADFRLLPKALTALTPSPLYVRGADATPMPCA